MTDSLAAQLDGHVAPCPLAYSRNWTWAEHDAPETGAWVALATCTCPSEEEPALASVASGGWTSPFLPVIDSFPEVTVKRGGISFTDPHGLKDLSEEQLRTRIEIQEQTIRKQRAIIGKLRKKNRRLLRLIGRIV